MDFRKFGMVIMQWNNEVEKEDLAVLMSVADSELKKSIDSTINAQKKVAITLKELGRNAYYTRDLSNKAIEEILDSNMDKRHDPLNKLLD